MRGMVIDSHHHFWAYSAREYGWISQEMATIRRDFLPPHLREVTRQAGVDGVISVQARQSLDETRWLLEMAGENDFILGVVGWVPLIAEDVRDHLAGFAANTKLRAVRHVVQDEPDDRYLLREDFNRGVRALREFDLRYDILIYERHLPQTIEFVDRHPGQVFILDHVAKPNIKSRQIEPWRTGIRELARRANVYCKVSGMVTEAHWHLWREEDLRPYWESALEAFGPARLMAGSDWPVCLVACGYEQWWEIIRGWTASLSKGERARVLGETAVEAYALEG